MLDHLQVNLMNIDRIQTPQHQKCMKNIFISIYVFVSSRFLLRDLCSYNLTLLYCIDIVVYSFETSYISFCDEHTNLRADYLDSWNLQGGYHFQNATICFNPKLFAAITNALSDSYKVREMECMYKLNDQRETT